MKLLSRRAFLRVAAQMSIALAGSQVNAACRDEPAVPSIPKLHRVGWLSEATPDWIGSPVLTAFRKRLGELGYVEGQSVTMHYSWAVVPLIDHNTVLDAAPVLRLVDDRVDVIVSENLAATWPATLAQSTVPVVFIVEADPVAYRLVESFARPGGNRTGVTHDNLAFTAGKRLQLLVDALPPMRRVAVLFDPKHNPGPWRDTETAAAELRVELVALQASTSEELGRAFDRLTQHTVEGLIIFSGGITNREGLRIVRFARQQHLATMLDFGDWVADTPDSALMSFNPSDVALYRRLADYVDKILRGAKAGEIPVERPTEYELAINLSLADAMGLSISPSVLAQATRLIR